MFVGRKQELDTLNSLYRKDSFEFVVMYGRRRVGKTTLINEFIKDKKAIFYSGLETNEKSGIGISESSIWKKNCTDENKAVYVCGMYQVL